MNKNLKINKTSSISEQLYLLNSSKKEQFVGEKSKNNNFQNLLDDEIKKLQEKDISNEEKIIKETFLIVSLIKENFNLMEISKLLNMDMKEVTSRIYTTLPTIDRDLFLEVRAKLNNNLFSTVKKR